MDGAVGERIVRTDISHFRPAHIHFLLSVPGYELLITHLFQEGAEYLDSDVVFGTRVELVVEFKLRELVPPPTAARARCHGYWRGMPSCCSRTERPVSPTRPAGATRVVTGPYKREGAPERRRVAWSKAHEQVRLQD